MRRILLFAAAAALIARATVFADSGAEGTFISFALFWVFAAGYFVAELTS